RVNGGRDTVLTPVCRASFRHSRNVPHARSRNRKVRDMKNKLILVVCLLATSAQWSCAPKKGVSAPSAPASTANAEQEVISLSKDKWRWMAERNIEALDKLFAPEAVFVHMGGTMSKEQELDVIKSGRIQ